MSRHYAVDFDYVVNNSNSIKELNDNIRAYLKERNLTDTVEGSEHFWRLFYAWKATIKYLDGDPVKEGGGDRISYRYGGFVN